ncbi:PREDICTED: uncharacterized protein LOC105143041 [Acromyrmex echinatior]|uniref:uncharacterized protein LOC105143041 n=1 Tax=Acromyrmex echinatior TaxID=103372 RepID=UPI000580ECFD|nr:PREDICTED: uncharacterized protein LOC105143041 [Acromyrmex echinatior]
MAIAIRVSPADLMVHGRAENFRWLEAAHIRGRISASLRHRDQKDDDGPLVEFWRKRLESDPEISVKRTMRVISPHLKEWIEKDCALSYRLTQVFSGHGCFGEYLCRIGRELITE